MNESHEPSYYEIALTNRQVVVAFVLILSSVMAAFLSGVWVGSQGAGEPVQIAEADSQQAASQDSLDQVPPLGFFEDGEGESAQKADLDKPDLTPLLEEKNQNTTLAQDVGRAPKKLTDEEKKERRRRRNAKRTEKPVIEEGGAPPPPTKKPAQQQAQKPAPPPPKAAAPPPPTAATVDSGFIIQVFSSHDQAQAKKVMGQLKNSGYKAFLLSTDDNPPMHRVRIGPFPARDEAEKVAQRVKADHKIDTWVTSADN